MKILITGGAGFIATNTAIEAIKRGHTVVAFDNLSRNEVKNNISYMEEKYKDKYTFVWGDVRKRGDFAKLGSDIEAVINFAANPSVINSIKNPSYDFETNVGGTFHALEYARMMKIPYIYASTNKVYSDITNQLAMEEKETRLVWKRQDKQVLSGIDLTDDGTPESINEYFPLSGFGKFGHSMYGISKLSGELYVQEYGIQFGIPVVMFRMSCIYGLFQKGVEEQAWVSHFIRQIIHGDGSINIYGNGKQVRDVLDGRDTARAYLDALENIDKVNRSVYTLGGGKDQTLSLLEAISLIEEISNEKATLKFFNKRPADQDIYISSLKSIKRDLGWEPKIKPEQTIRDMIKEEMIR